MNDNLKRHNDKIDELLEKYKASGYVAIKNPAKNDIPFDLGNYSPDLIVKKGDSGFIIEVKTSSSSVSLDKFQEIATEVASHNNWRFLLVTLEDIYSDITQGEFDQIPNWEDLKSKLQKANQLFSIDAYEALLLFLWSIFEAALRRRAIEIHLPVARLPLIRLLQHMYSSGEISVKMIDLVKQFMLQRNRVAHGMQEQLSEGIIKQYFLMVESLFGEWIPLNQPE